MALEFKAKLCLAWRWSSKRSFVWHGVGVQSEALFGMALEFKTKFFWPINMGLEFKAKLCLAAQSFALNSNVSTMRYFKNNKLNPHF
jgi:hypothetical protein